MNNMNEKFNLIQNKSGLVLKKGDGPIDYDWNERYLVLDASTLMYFKNHEEKTPRGFIKIKDCIISQVIPQEDRDHSFVIETFIPARKYIFSTNSRDETEQWRNAIANAIKQSQVDLGDGVNLRKSSFNIHNGELNKNFKGNGLGSSDKKIQSLLNNKYQTNQYPQELGSQSQILDDIENILEKNNEWTMIKYRSGVRIYEKTQVQLQRFIPLGQKSKNKNEIFELGGKMQIEEDYQKVFRFLKKRSSKQKLDSFIQGYQKQQSVEGLSKRTDFRLGEQGAGQNKNTFLMKSTTFRFVLNRERYYIINKMVSEDSSLTIFEVFIIQTYAQISGKCQMTYYTKIEKDSSNKKLSFFTRKEARKQVLQLALVRELLKEDTVKKLSLSIMNEKEINQTLIRQKTIQTENQQLYMSSESVYKKSKLNQNFKDFKEQINIISLLKENKLSNLKFKSLDERKPGYKREKDGGIGCYNKEEIKSQEGLVLQLMKDVGERLVKGKDVVGISLPVKIFEPRSTLERICDNWAFMPIYIKAATQTKDHLERFKLTITFVISGLYNGCKQMKPFNPILGETFQAFWPDGTKIDIEHTSHHPPVSHFYVQDKNDQFRFFGYYEYKAKLKGNSVVGSYSGPNTIQFSDGQIIKWVYPQYRISGLMYGTRVMDCIDSMEFEDTTNHFYCKIQFQESGSFFSPAPNPTDYLSGNIVNLSKGHVTLSKVEGSWVEQVSFDGKKYWEINYVDPSDIVKSETPLPSDCRYREDLIDLAAGDLNKAQDSKIRLEILQRKDRADRLERQKFFRKMMGME